MPSALKGLFRGGAAPAIPDTTAKFLPSFAGRPYDALFLADLPPGVDPCGERGEFHTFVWDGPIFQTPVEFRRTRIARNGEQIYCDLEPLP